MTEPHQVSTRLAKPRVKAIYERWLDENPIKSLPFTIVHAGTEVGFQVPLTDTIVYCGRMDLVARMKVTGQYVCPDFKTTRSVTKAWLRRWEMDTQISGYTYALRETTSMPVMGMILAVIGLPDPLVPDRKCQTHGVLQAECDVYHSYQKWTKPIYRSEEALEAWRLTMIRLGRRLRWLKKWQGIDAIPQLEMEGTFTSLQYTNACTFCDLREYCKDGRPIDNTFDNYFEHDPWWCFPDRMDMVHDPEVTYLDNTYAREVSTCSTLAYIKRVLGCQPKGKNMDAAHVGSAIHAGMEAYFTTEDPDKALEAFGAKYDELLPQPKASQWDGFTMRQGKERK